MLPRIRALTCQSVKILLHRSYYYFLTWLSGIAYFAARFLYITMPWKKSIPLHLPVSNGPYIPGCMDVMLDYSKSGSLMRLYYPTKSQPKQENYSKWPRFYDDENYIRGTAYAMYFSPTLLRLAFWFYGVYNFHIPVLYGEQANTDRKLKCILLSHGYAGHRGLYNIICNELASHGYLVCAIEHRDGSCCFTYYYESKEDAIRDIKSPIVATKLKRDQNHYELRNQQVRQKSDECCQVLDFLINLNNGTVPHNVLDDVKSNKQYSFELKDLVGKLDLDDISVMGHSFGGASALVTTSKRKEIKRAILLDPWMFPIKSDKQVLENITQPLLFINTATFHSLPSINLIKQYVAKNQESKVYTILHTTHESHVDTTFIFGHWLHLFMKKLDITQALTINNSLILKFLKDHTEHEVDIKYMEDLLKKEEANILVGFSEDKSS